MGKFNIIQFALYQALFAAMLGIACGFLYPFIGDLLDGGFTSNWPSTESIIDGYSFFIFLLKGLGTLLKFVGKWLLAIICISWLFGIVGFIAGLLEGLVIKPIIGLFGAFK